jgi:hypothetical protein
MKVKCLYRPQVPGSPYFSVLRHPSSGLISEDFPRLAPRLVFAGLAGLPRARKTFRLATKSLGT